MDPKPVFLVDYIKGPTTANAITITKMSELKCYENDIFGWNSIFAGTSYAHMKSLQCRLTKGKLHRLFNWNNDVPLQTKTKFQSVLEACNRSTEVCRQRIEIY